MTDGPIKSLFEPSSQTELRDRALALRADSPRQWGVLAYRHLDHHFRQFGV